MSFNPLTCSFSSPYEYNVTNQTQFFTSSLYYKSFDTSIASNQRAHVMKQTDWDFVVDLLDSIDDNGYVTMTDDAGCIFKLKPKVNK